MPPYSVLRADLIIPPIATIVKIRRASSRDRSRWQLVTAFGSGFRVPGRSRFPASRCRRPGRYRHHHHGQQDIERGSLYYVSPSQASFLIPSGMAVGAASVKVTRSGTTVLTGSITVAAVSPGLYAENGNGSGVPAALAERVSVSGAVTPGVFLPERSAAQLSVIAAQPGELHRHRVCLAVRDGNSGCGNGSGVHRRPVGTVTFGAQSQYQGLDQVNVAIPSSLAGMGRAASPGGGQQGIEYDYGKYSMRSRNAVVGGHDRFYENVLGRLRPRGPVYTAAHLCRRWRIWSLSAESQRLLLAGSASPFRRTVSCLRLRLRLRPLEIDLKSSVVISSPRAGHFKVETVRSTTTPGGHIP